MVFYGVFWSTYVPFVLLTLSILAERLRHLAESDAAAQARLVPASAQRSRRVRKK